MAIFSVFKKRMFPLPTTSPLVVKSDIVKSYATTVGCDLLSIVKSVVNESVKARRNKERDKSSVVMYGLQESNNDLAKVRGLHQVYDCADSVVRISRLGKPVAGSDGANSKQKCRPLKVELWSQGDREFVLQQVKTICDSISGKLYVAKYLNAAYLAVVKEVRSKCADLNRNATPCSDG